MFQAVRAVVAVDPFRQWLRARGLRRTAMDLGVSHTAAVLWARGGGVKQANREGVKALAAQEGVELSTDDLMPIA